MTKKIREAVSIGIIILVATPGNARDFVIASRSTSEKTPRCVAR
ncbi:MAG TPA: hypothetical protein VH083_11235 [Myxococcales bacterium]|jgi:hypothetical protein|nr:hypothetical protein [Myxococcales bacterium]